MLYIYILVDLFYYSCPINTSCKSHGRADDSLYSLHFVNSHHVVKIADFGAHGFFTRGFLHVKSVYRVRSLIALFANSLHE